MHVNWKNCRFVSKLYELLTVHLSFPIGPHWQFGHVLTCLTVVMVSRMVFGTDSQSYENKTQVVKACFFFKLTRYETHNKIINNYTMICIYLIKKSCNYHAELFHY